MADASLTAAQIVAVAAPQPPLGALENAISTGQATRHREPNLPPNADVLAMIRRFSSIAPPERALDYHWYLMALVLAYCDVPDITTFETYLSREDFREALDHAPPGVFDVRSWHYWNIVCGRTPAPPLPKRKATSTQNKSNTNSRWS